MDKNEKFFLRLQGWLKIHPDIIAFGILPELNGINPSSVVAAASRSDWYRKQDNAFVPVSLDVYYSDRKNSSFLVALISEGASYWEAREVIDESPERNPEYHSLYRMVELEVKGEQGSTHHQVYYLMASAKVRQQ